MEYETLDGIIVDFFNGLGWWGNLLLIIISLLLATILGGVIGIQRELNGHAAGFRTHVLISLATALIMIISIYGLSSTNASGTRDPMRLAAAGVAGAGFIGAGCIIKNGSTVKGLTTSATIWLVTAIGLCCGCGWFVIAIVVTVIAWIVLVVFAKVDVWVNKKNAHIVVLSDLDSPVLSQLLEYLEKYHIQYKDLSSSFTDHEGQRCLRTHITCSGKSSDEIQEFIQVFKDEVKPIDILLIK